MEYVTDVAKELEQVVAQALVLRPSIITCLS